MVMIVTSRQVRRDDSLAVRTEDVGVLLKALDVLELLAGPRPSGLTEMTKMTGVNKASVYRILRTLESRGFAVQEPDTKKYTPGPRLMALASSLMGNADITSVILPVLNELNRQFDETINYGTIIDDGLRYLHIIESKRNLRTVPHAGYRDYIHSTAIGKAIVAAMEPFIADAVVARIAMVRLTDRTITERKVLRKQLELIRKRGYALDDEESELGSRCVAVPILYHGSQPIGGLSISGPKFRLDDTMISRMAGELQKAASVIESQLESALPTAVRRARFPSSEPGEFTIRV